MPPSNQKLSLHNHNNMSTSATLYFFGRLLSYWNDERINKLSNSKTMRLILRSGICNPNWAHPFKIHCPPYGTTLSGWSERVVPYGGHCFFYIQIKLIVPHTVPPFRDGPTNKTYCPPYGTILSR